MSEKNRESMERKNYSGFQASVSILPFFLHDPCTESAKNTGILHLYSGNTRKRMNGWSG